MIVLNSCLYNGKSHLLCRKPGVELIKRRRRIAFVALRVYSIWDRRKNVKILLCVALVVVQVIVFILGGKSVASFASSLHVFRDAFVC